jgi:hypothetical protein
MPSSTGLPRPAKTRRMLPDGELDDLLGEGALALLLFAISGYLGLIASMLRRCVCSGWNGGQERWPMPRHGPPATRSATQPLDPRPAQRAHLWG